jgi:hypothetical protein
MQRLVVPVSVARCMSDRCQALKQTLLADTKSPTRCGWHPYRLQSLCNALKSSNRCAECTWCNTWYTLCAQTYSKAITSCLARLLPSNYALLDRAAELQQASRRASKGNQFTFCVHST